ncbi:MAG: NAD-dependent epimerase/dehydratase family protein, partial [Chlorobia bacterium]|nr:NAD-dependent epimerase/dehydratase family protein [Fimbriimonadaceae bacterium]
MKVVIAGGTGFIGHALAEEFQTHGYESAILTRSRKRPGTIPQSVWDGETVGDWAGLLEGAAAVVNLAGESVTLRWTDENKRRILDSRTKSTAAIGKAIRQCATPPKVWINASAVGYYGDRGDEELDETSSAGEGFMPECCLAWERAQEEVETPGVRKARVRVGVVLGKDGGAFAELSKITKR